KPCATLSKYQGKLRPLLADRAHSGNAALPRNPDRPELAAIVFSPAIFPPGAAQDTDRHMSPSAQNTKYDLAALVMAGFALYAVLDLGLLAAFLAAVLVHELVHVTAPFVQLGRLTHKTSKAIVLAILATVSILLLSS